ncbi:low molecular weight protein-tyrosine-phosphatase [Alterisphingorhabdus coralli]|uniref:protein-tyrosine-phosphatase n=1 Tax=Alterisphingorhabdus coralli TaxID=3071408 RepID=A0AA97I1U3_9SPHN|nr:low molecular weight protein-tyrosine-phosphatase [Parasphingorhabdus sp. SCSIO 66989]WOE75693.1 low molecular weight protein-tyrosine-phosphatase [Parasphingorhabdus sp. SCSIO 66989]
MSTFDPDSEKATILFVCLGNICRSPLAEAAMRVHAHRHGFAIEIDSAGTGAWHIGNSPDPGSIKAATKAGIDIRHQRARQVRRADFDDFRHIVAMDRSNLTNLEAMRPDGSKADLRLLLDYLPGDPRRDVPDPYGGGSDDFAEVWGLVNRATANLLKALMQGESSPA